ncbi:MAG: bifunctional methylenetetrahydrofolate dehydrogenase/methenyltetrahydrofolate cyclohydrolase FolD [Pseudomonadota bacterium]|jgi:methylenetetrahydrofolate dehydrogenase (NADP+)/methenyltetrahydrofolate cyclohydrolase
MSEARIIDGKAFAQRIQADVTAAASALVAEHGIRPGLAVVLVGEDAASQVYVRNKGQQAEACGFHSVTRRLPAETTEAELLAVVGELNADPTIHGLLVQLPLPGHLDANRIIAAIDPNKDVDGLTVTNAGRLSAGLPGLVPCTPSGCMLMLQEALGDLKGKRAVMVGRSNLMGKPMAQLLLQADCTVTIAHSRTKDLPAVCREAEILVVAVGRAEMVKGDWIRPGAVVLDVGMNRVPSKDPVKAAEGKTRLVGDVAFDEAKAVAGWITPVPGGVGLATVACLLRNTVLAACLIHGLPAPKIG